MIQAKGSSWDGAADGTDNVIADVANKIISTYTADGTVAEQCGLFFITKGSAAQITLPSPVSGDPATGGSDGMEMHFITGSPYAHIITCATGFNGANTSGTATFNGSLGSSITLKALGGFWYVKAAQGINEFAANASQAWLQGINTTLLNGTDPVTVTISTLTTGAVNTALASIQTEIEAILTALR
jgi:hypothetical protein